jgi:hypothetical protein
LIVWPGFGRVFFLFAEKAHCYLGTKADCERFAEELGGCRVTRATEAQIEERAKHALNWRLHL